MNNGDRYQRQFFLQGERERFLEPLAIAQIPIAVLRRNRRWIAVGLCAGVLMTAGDLHVAPVIYTSTVTIKVTKPPGEFLPVDGSGSSPEFYSLPF